MIELILSSVKNLRRKGVRTSLTIASIAIGVASVIIIQAIGAAGTRAVNNELDSIGIGGVLVSINSEKSKAKLTQSDLDTINDLNCVSQAMPIVTGVGKSSANGKQMDTVIWGVDSGANQIISLNVKYGRELNKQDIASSKNVCLIDVNMAKEFYKRENIVGKTISILINGLQEEYEIVGIVAADSGILQSLMGEYIPSFIYLPYTNMQRIHGNKNISQIAVKIKDESSIDLATQKIELEVSRTNGTKDMVKTENLVKQRDRLGNLLSIVTTVLSIIGGISLVVAGLGIMTVMLVSVNERTREIGIKKSIGAKKRHILFEFLLEALTISLIGSIIGCSIGLSLTQLASAVISMTIPISISQVVYCIFIAMLIGIIFGVYPAMKASKLNPVDALRRE